MDWTETGFRPSTEPIAAAEGEDGVTVAPSTTGSVDPADADERTARPDRRDADLQQVIDRYEAVIERQRPDGAGRTERSPARRLLQSVRARVDAFRMDVEIALRSRRD